MSVQGAQLVLAYSLSSEGRRFVAAWRSGRLPVRLPEVCGNGHERTPENTRVRPSGSRACRDCEREACERSRQRKRAAASARPTVGEGP